MKYKIVFLAIMFFGLSAYYFANNKYYPVAVVNGEFISARDFEREFNAALVYYQNVIRTYSEQRVDLASVGDFVFELRRATLDNLIEDVLVYNELEDRVSNGLDEAVARKIPDFNESAAALYGLSVADFKEMVLVPQAHRELLSSQLEKDKGEI